ncbi:MAG: FtsX-like permease family protein [Bacteroidales bacterium]|nr:FtsX-like permease family protein [Bacteroidales bacterium]
MIWIVAWKNVWRNKARSLVVVMAIAFGLLGGVFSSAVLKGTSDQRVREAVSRETSHLQIHNKAYTDDNEVKFVIGGDLEKLDNVLDTMKGIEAWSPRVKFMAMAGSANAGTGVMVMGIDPDRESRVTEIHSLIRDSCGTWFQACKGVPVIVGEALTKKLKVRLHSKIVLTFQDMQGNLTGGAFRICGIYRTSNSVFDEMNVFVTRTDVIPLLAAETNSCHEIAMRMKDAGIVEQIQSTLKTLFPALLIQNWKEIDPLLGMLNDFMDLWLYLFMGIIMLALGFGIINTMLMAILERTRELGMLAAIGMNKQKIFSLIMLESVFLSLTGGIIGITMGTALTWYTNLTGINLGTFTEGFEKIGYNPMLYPSLDLFFFINLTLMVIATGILASVYPARRALKLRPAEAIRND